MPRFADHRQHLHSIISAVRAASAPFDLVATAHPPALNLGVLSVGKAAPAMDAAAGSPLGRRLIVTTDGTPLWGDPDLAEVVDHPLPSARNVRAAERVLRFVDVARHIAAGRHEFAAAEGLTPEHIARALGDSDPAGLPIVLMLSGGASACLASPMPGLGIEHVRNLTAALLRAGCPIEDLNTVRRHLELLKGGRLAAHAYPVPIEAMVLSDVVSGDVSAIGSGPVSPDPSTFADALDVLRRTDTLDVVPAATRFLEAGARGEHPETAKPDDPRLSRVRVRVVGSVGLVADAALARATELGFSIAHCHTPMVGDAQQQGVRLGELARGCTPGPTAVILAGETTVTVPRGSGLGGRNQHLALSAALAIDGVEGVAIATFATDGVDGPTDAAGAIVTGRTAGLIRTRGIDPSAALEQRDSHRALDAAGALVRTGPTGTNVNDLAVALVY